MEDSLGRNRSSRTSKKKKRLKEKLSAFLFKHFRKSDLETFSNKATKVTNNISNYTTVATATSSRTTTATTTNNNNNNIHKMLIN